MAEKLASGSVLSEQPLVVLSPAERLIYREESTGISPETVAGILSAANIGNYNRLAKLSFELEEKDWDIGQALQVRTACVKSTDWDIVAVAKKPRRSAVKPAKEPKAPGEGTAEVVAWMDETISAIEGDPAESLADFDQMLENTCHAFLPGMSVNEIVWAEGGAAVRGFQHVPAFHFTYWQSRYPRLITREHRQEGEELPAGRFLIHRHLPRGGDATRGGLIRPLAWAYLFKNILVKQLMRYGEKYGMPFIAVQIDSTDKKIFEEEARRVRRVVQNFGADGGGVFSKSTILDFKAPPGGGGKAGEFFFTGVEYFQRAINKVLLGQTSTSDSKDSNRSTADVHNLVRHDLQVADCWTVAKTVKQQLFLPLTRNKFGDKAPVPELDFDIYQWADLKVLAEFLKTAKDAGFELEDADELSRRAGMTFKKAEPKAIPPALAQAAGLPGDNGNGKLKEEEPANALAN